MSDSLLRSANIDRRLMSMSSILMMPVHGSTIRKSVRNVDDFPAPVRPTMPIFCAGVASKSSDFSTGGRSGRYFIETPSNLIWPRAGQSAGGRGAPKGASTSSDSTSAYSSTRSTELKEFSARAARRTTILRSPVICRAYDSDSPTLLGLTAPAFAPITRRTAVTMIINPPRTSRRIESHRFDDTRANMKRAWPSTRVALCCATRSVARKARIVASPARHCPK
mmetsp:Transcript_9220/g.23649  ORF Transcript_9220/g.23649 Transcript_9220/m.23649 type:complete len:223 (-) Transcript_9220:556-1224(-)